MLCFGWFLCKQKRLSFTLEIFPKTTLVYNPVEVLIYHTKLKWLKVRSINEVMGIYQSRSYVKIILYRCEFL